MRGEQARRQGEKGKGGESDKKKEEIKGRRERWEEMIYVVDPFKHVSVL